MLQMGFFHGICTQRDFLAWGFALNSEGADNTIDGGDIYTSTVFLDWALELFKMGYLYFSARVCLNYYFVPPFVYIINIIILFIYS